MAILANFSACIRVDSEPCQEFADDEGEEQDENNVKSHRRVVKYVEAVPGAHFAIKTHSMKPLKFNDAHAVSCRVRVDGSYVANRNFHGSEFKNRASLGKVIEDGSFLKRFKFASILTRILTHRVFPLGC